MEKIREILFSFVNQIEKLNRKENYDYIILANSRTLCLMYGIEEIKTKKFYKKIFSFEKVDILSTDLKGKKVLIADFMMERGIHTAKIYESIKKYEPSLIHTVVGIRKIGHPLYYEYKTQPYTGNLFIVNYEDCIEYFKLLYEASKFIYSINQPYVSNMYSFDISNEYYTKFKENKDIEEKYYKENITFPYMKDDEVKYFNCTSIKYNFIIAAFFRIYPSSNSNNVLVIPQIELVPLTCSQVNDVWDQLNIPIQLKTTVDKYKAIKTILAYALYKKYFEYNSNETKWIDKSYVDDFISIIDKSLDFPSVFEMVEDVIGDIISPIRDTQNRSIMQKELETLSFDNIYDDMSILMACSYNEMLIYIQHLEIFSIEGSVDSILSPITPLAMHELLSKISSEKLSELYTYILYNFDIDCIKPCIYVKDGFVETFLDIFYG